MATRPKTCHDEANQGSGGRKGPCKTCQFKRKSTEGGSHCVTGCRQVMTVLQPFVMNRLDICRQRTTSLLAITPEKDTHAQNRERVPLKIDVTKINDFCTVCIRYHFGLTQLLAFDHICL